LPIHFKSPPTRGAVLSPLLSKSRTRRRISALRALILHFVIFIAVIFFNTVIPSRACAAQASKNSLSFDEMYSSASSLGLVLSEKLKSLDGENVVMEGFMAPPLKPTLRFFVLTSVPMAICPFCSTDANWPNNIVLVFLDKEALALPFDRPIRVEGTLELGSKTDEETGFVSLVRIFATRVEAAM
jgi:hypothetical protein